MEITKEIIDNLKWNVNVKNRKEKELLGEEIAKRVKDGDVIGFGSGTTSFMASLAIGERVKKEGLKIKAIPTSNDIELVCRFYDIEITNLNESNLDWCFDGADEVDSNNWLIKGLGAAMFKEKLNIVNSNENYILVDSSKIVNTLGEKCVVPIEVFPTNINYVIRKLEELGAYDIKIRKDENGENVITENNNLIVDARFKEVYEKLEKEIKDIVGVIESGLFIDYNVIIKKV